MFVPKPGPIWHQFQSTGSHYNGKKRRGQRQTGPVVLLPVFASSPTHQYPLVFVTLGDCSPNFWRQRVNFFDTMLQELRAAVPAFGMSPSSRLRATTLQQLLLLYSSCSSCSILTKMKEHSWKIYCCTLHSSLSQ